MFAGIGSARIAAKLCSPIARSRAAGSFQGTTTVFAACDSGTPGLAGTPAVAIPEPASTRSPSTWPW